MPCIQKEELPQILAIAQCIAVHCVANGPEFDRNMDFATAPLVANRKIRIAPVAEQFTDPDFYAASSLIELRIPNQGCVKFRTRGMPAPDSIVVRNVSSPMRRVAKMAGQVPCLRGMEHAGGRGTGAC